MGHGDALCITDAGLPIPTGVLRIDLAFAPGQPAIPGRLDAVLSELRVERYTMAKESSPHIVDALRMRLRTAAESSVPHQEQKRDHRGGQGGRAYWRVRPIRQRDPVHQRRLQPE